MKSITATSPGKIILFGEHAVVYGQPALAAPIHDLRATATASTGSSGQGITIRAEDLGMRLSLAEAASHALAQTVQQVLIYLQADEPDIDISVTSTIPIAAGLGSGAAVSAALAQALASYLDQPLDQATLSSLVYEVEKLHHGTPSGIDNTVICYEQAVYFIREQTLDTLHIRQPFYLLIGDTGVASPTKIAVGDVRKGWQIDPDRYNAIFDAVGEIAVQARRIIETGDPTDMGDLMTANHRLLIEMGVSSTELDRLVEAAIEKGAYGAKLSGGGRGGNMIALVDDQSANAVSEALKAAGATRVTQTVVR